MFEWLNRYDLQNVIPAKAGIQPAFSEVSPKGRFETSGFRLRAGMTSVVISLKSFV